MDHRDARGTGEQAVPHDGVASAADDLFNVLASTEDGFYHLGQDLRLTPLAVHAHPHAGVGDERVRQLANRLAFQPAHADLERGARHVLSGAAAFEQEVQGEDGRWFRLRFRPYRKNGSEAAAGVTVVVTDISEHKRAEGEKEEILARLAELAAAHERREKEQASEVRRLSVELLLAERRERKRIAQILHDDFQQLLYALKIRIDAVLEGAPVEAHGATLRELVEQASALTRTLLVSMAPPIQESDDLVATLSWLVEYVRDRYGVVVEAEHEGSLLIPDEERRVLLFELAREFLFNVVKHAGVDRARVALHREGNEVRVVVEDEGRGFDVEAVLQKQREGNYGLSQIRRRLFLLGGRLEVESAPGAGTRVRAMMPL